MTCGENLAYCISFRVWLWGKVEVQPLTWNTIDGYESLSEYPPEHELAPYKSR